MSYEMMPKPDKILKPLVKESQEKIDTQELPPPAEFKVRSELEQSEAKQVESTLPEAPNFKLRSELEAGEIRQVEYNRDVLKIADAVFKDSAFKGILAEFAADNFNFRDEIDNTNILKLINNFIQKYPTLEDFETRGNIDNFLIHISKPEKYTKAVADFEDLFYNHHKER